MEIGAHDGIFLSNTRWLEQCFGWRGILVEGSPHNYKALLRSRRDASAKIHAAASCHEPATVNFTDDRLLAKLGLSGVPQHLDLLHGSKAASRGGISRVIAQQRYQTVAVPCRSVATIMHETHSYVDFFSLDTEGAEAQVLATANPSLFGVVKVETGYGHNGKEYSEKDREVARLLEAAGMRRVKALTHGERGRDHVFASQSVLRRCARGGSRR